MSETPYFPDEPTMFGAGLLIGESMLCIFNVDPVAEQLIRRFFEKALIETRFEDDRGAALVAHAILTALDRDLINSLADHIRSEVAVN
ncbi:MAG: hypothetical protein DI547_16190 [Sphingobium sp.]|nr:MAG: hypothetical protein DI547_16190 [Sphingobium sp.]